MKNDRFSNTHRRFMIILPIHCTALNAANNQVHCHFSIWNWANTSNLAKTKNKIYLVNCKWVDSIVTRMHISDWIVNLFAFFRLRKKNAFNLPFGANFFSLATCYILHVKRSAISIRSYIYCVVANRIEIFVVPWHTTTQRNKYLLMK